MKNLVFLLLALHLSILFVIIHSWADRITGAGSASGVADLALEHPQARVHRLAHTHLLSNSPPDPDGVTVLILSHNGTTPLRRAFLESALDYYTGRDVAKLVKRVILVWNGDGDPPRRPGVLLLQSDVNSLNNRWLLPIPYIDTDAVLNLDDDVMVTRDGLLCLLAAWRRDRTSIYGPYVRTYQGAKYVMDELSDRVLPYAFVLPRMVLLSKAHLQAYEHRLDPGMKAYVDEQEAHCDDIALNLMVANATGRAPQRVIPPPGTVYDLYECRHYDKRAIGGLGLDAKRRVWRSECYTWLQAEAARAWGMAVVPKSTTFEACAMEGDWEEEESEAQGQGLAAAFEAMKLPLPCSKFV